MTSAGALKVTLMIRHKQEREELSLPRRERSLHHKELGRRLFHKTTRGHSPGPLFPAPLSPCQRTLLRTRAISVHFLRAASKANKQEPAQYLRKQLFLPLGVRNLHPHHPPSPTHTHIKHSDKERTFQDTDTVAETDRPFQQNSCTGQTHTCTNTKHLY